MTPTQTLWFFPVQIGCDIEFCLIFVVISLGKCLWFFKKKRYGENANRWLYYQRVAESFPISLYRLFLGPLLFQNFVSFKIVTIWIISYWRYRWCWKNDHPGFAVFLGAVGVKLHRSQGKLKPEFGVCSWKGVSALSPEAQGGAGSATLLAGGLVCRGQREVAWPLSNSCDHRSHCSRTVSLDIKIARKEPLVLPKLRLRL